MDYYMTGRYRYIFLHKSYIFIVGNLENTDKLKQKDRNLPEFITQKQDLKYKTFLYECIDRYRM